MVTPETGRGFGRAPIGLLLIVVAILWLAADVSGGLGWSLTLPTLVMIVGAAILATSRSFRT